MAKQLLFHQILIIFILNLNYHCTCRKRVFIDASGIEQNIFLPFGTLHTLNKLTYWAEKESEIYSVFLSRLELLKKQINLIKRYKSDYESSSMEALKQAKKDLFTRKEKGARLADQLIGSSAVLSHMMTFRYATVIADLRDLLNSGEYQRTEERMNQVLEVGPYKNDSNDWPDSEDFYTSNLAILHIHEHYNYKPSQIYKGFKLETDIEGELNAAHCAHLGVFALSLGFFSMGIEWLEFAVQLLQEKSKDDSISLGFVETSLKFAVNEHNHLYRSNPRSTNTFSKITYPGELNRLSNRQKMVQSEGGIPGNGTNPGANMLLLCRGIEFQPEAIRSKMKCYFKREGHPYLKLNPLKVEQLSEHPYLLLVHDIVGEETITEYFKRRGTLGVPKAPSVHRVSLKQSLQVKSSVGGTMNPEFEKIMLPKTDLIMKVPQKGLDSGLAFLATAEYVYGRHYNHHKDPLSHDSETDIEITDEVLMSNPVATILYYFEAPKAGGATPFCEVGISVLPKRGSALFWYNMFKNGTVRTDISHASCPVIHGNKIIVTQWVSLDARFRDCPCSLNQFE